MATRLVFMLDSCVRSSMSINMFGQLPLEKFLTVGMNLVNIVDPNAVAVVSLNILSLAMSI